MSFRWKCAGLAIVFFSLFAPNAMATVRYRLDLEVYATAPFPFLKRFGSVDVSVFPEGVGAEMLLIRGFSRNNTSTVTIMNPIARLYAEIPIAQMRSILLKLGGQDSELMPGLAEFPIDKNVIAGTVKGIPARRYRVILGESWIDVWTSTQIPRNPQLIRLLSEVLGTVSRSSSILIERIPGTPLYVEMNTKRFKKLVLVRPASFQQSDSGAADALSVGRFYVKAPFSDILFKE